MELTPFPPGDQVLAASGEEFIGRVDASAPSTCSVAVSAARPIRPPLPCQDFARLPEAFSKPGPIRTHSSGTHLHFALCCSESLQTHDNGFLL